MFDDLDDPNPPAAGGDSRAAVAARARRLRRRRTAWVAGGTSLTLVLAAVTGAAVALRDPGSDRVVQSLATTDPAPYETIDPSYDPVIDPETPSPTTPSREPTETPERTTEAPDPVPPVTATPSPTATHGGSRFPGSEPDGKPGWSGGFSGCDPRETMLPEGGELPFPSVTTRLVLPETMKAGEPVESTLVVTNTGSEPVAFDMTGEDTAVRNKATGEMGGDYWNDAIMVHRVELGAGEKTEIRLSVATTTCGDTKDDDAPLTAGEYVFAAGIHWNTARSEAGTSRSGYWGVHADGHLG